VHCDAAVYDDVVDAHVAVLLMHLVSVPPVRRVRPSAQYWHAALLAHAVHDVFNDAHTSATAEPLEPAEPDAVEPDTVEALEPVEPDTVESLTLLALELEPLAGITVEPVDDEPVDADADDVDDVDDDDAVLALVDADDDEAADDAGVGEALKVTAMCVTSALAHAVTDALPQNESNEEQPAVAITVGHLALRPLHIPSHTSSGVPPSVHDWQK